MIKFPSIEQYRNVIHNVKFGATHAQDVHTGELVEVEGELPTIKYRGTVKLHGTNASIVHDIKGSGFIYQSRERELSLTQDNAGFMLYMENHSQGVWSLFEMIYTELGYNGAEADCPSIAIYGEWCGQGIQKGVAISELPKMFVIFGIKAYWSDDAETQATWLDLTDYHHIQSPEDRIFNIVNFETYEIDIDFKYPEIAQAKMVEITEAVEAECPVGKEFGVSGIGEGVVWAPVDNRWNNSRYWFKVKGEKHSASKVRTLAAVDVEAAATIREFVENTVTEARLEQGLHVLQNELQKPFVMQSLGDFIRWVFNDIVKEEEDTIVASGLDPKKLGGPIANAARPWYIKKFNSQ